MAGRANLVLVISVDVLSSTLVIEPSVTTLVLFDLSSISGSGLLPLGGAGAMVPSPGALISLNFLRFVGINRN